MKKVMCAAFLRMPLMSLVARGSTAVMLAPCLVGRHASMPSVMHGAIRDRRTSSFVAARKCWQSRTGSHRCGASRLLTAPASTGLNAKPQVLNCQCPR